MYIFLNGKIVHLRDAKIAICDHGFLYGDAVYETLRTVKGFPWLFKEHFVRLKNSAKSLGIPVQYKESDLIRWISALIKKNKLKESKIRITLSRGCNDFDFTSCKKPTIVIEAHPLALLPKKIYDEGVNAVTFRAERPFPDIKSTSMLPSIMARKEAKKKKAYEAFLVDHKGNATEGSISNFFIIKKNIIYTPKEGALKGTVCAYLAKLLAKNYRVTFKNIPHKTLYSCDEMFLTSTVKGVVPVVSLDGKKIGNGKVGAITREIISHFTHSLYGN